MAFVYDAVQFSGNPGPVFASAAVFGGLSQSSGAQIYAPTQNGWQTASVIITFDVFMTANGGWWKIMLDRTTLVTTLEYHDTEQTTEPAGVRTWIMTPDKCVLNSY